MVERAVGVVDDEEGLRVGDLGGFGVDFLADAEQLQGEDRRRVVVVVVGGGGSGGKAASAGGAAGAGAAKKEEVEAGVEA